MTTFFPAALLDAIAHSRRPHLTWYGGPDGAERLELSGHVLANWVAKSANFLDEEGVGRGDVVVVDLPVHWRAVVWVWAAWLRGASISFRDAARGTLDGDASDGSDRAAVIVTDRPEHHAGRGDGALVVAVPLAPLAMRWETEMPAGVVDGAEVMRQADTLLIRETVDGRTTSIADSGLSFEYLDAAIGTGDGTRVAFVPGSVWVLIRTAFSAWRGGGSVVILGESVSQGRRETILAQEGARFMG